MFRFYAGFPAVKIFISAPRAVTIFSSVSVDGSCRPFRIADSWGRFIPILSASAWIVRPLARCAWLSCSIVVIFNAVFSCVQIPYPILFGILSQIETPVFRLRKPHFWNFYSPAVAARLRGDILPWLGCRRAYWRHICFLSNESLDRRI